MLIAYLAFGFLVGAGTATLALVNGSGLLLALVAYSASGALSLLIPFIIHAYLAGAREEQTAWVGASKI